MIDFYINSYNKKKLYGLGMCKNDIDRLERIVGWCVRSNKILKNNYIYSIYYKGKIRENRINREFNSEIRDIKIKLIDKN